MIEERIYIRNSIVLSHPRSWGEPMDVVRSETTGLNMIFACSYSLQFLRAEAVAY